MNRKLNNRYFQRFYNIYMIQNRMKQYNQFENTVIIILNVLEGM